MRLQPTSVVGLVVRISAFQADGPGSIPGQRILFVEIPIFGGGSDVVFPR